MAALASWLDARAHCGTWLLRIEDLDPPREQPGAEQAIRECLGAFGLESDEPVVWQHERLERYQGALERLLLAGDAYVCECSRTRIAEDGARLGLAPGVYPGTCRQRGLADANGRAVRLHVPREPITFVDRACGEFVQDVEHDVGDFVIRRADGLFAYQLAVVVDDAAQAITDIVRGADLLDNTPRQIALQRLLRLPTPRYLHLPIVTGADGAKLSKQNGAIAVDGARALEELNRAGRHLGMPEFRADSPAAFLRIATEWWRGVRAGTPTMSGEKE